MPNCMNGEFTSAMNRCIYVKITNFHDIKYIAKDFEYDPIVWRIRPFPNRVSFGSINPFSIQLLVNIQHSIKGRIKRYKKIQRTNHRPRGLKLLSYMTKSFEPTVIK